MVMNGLMERWIVQWWKGRKEEYVDGRGRIDGTMVKRRKVRMDKLKDEVS